MTIGLTTELDTSRFVSMLRDLQTISGKDFNTVLLSQAGAILQFCIAKTKAASPQRIRSDFSKGSNRSERFSFPGGEIISKSRRSGHGGDIEFFDVSTARAGRPPKFSKGGKAWHDMTRWHWSDERWAKFQAMLSDTDRMAPDSYEKEEKRDLRAALDSVGLARHSWYQIAEALGIEGAMKVASYVRTAKPQNGKTYQNGTAKAVLDISAAYIEMSNDYKAAARLGGQQLINYAIIARAKAFEREVELGVFRDLKTRAQRYPGLFVSNS